MQILSSRSRWFGLITGLLSLLPFLPAIAQDAMFRGGPTHEGVYTSTSPTLTTLAWKFRTTGRVLSSPVVSGDMVFVGSTDGQLYAIDKTNGTQRWKFATQGPIASSPAVSGGLVYISSV